MKKGSILLHTLVMTVILSMISVMVMRWVLARYIIANRVQESSAKTSVAQGYFGWQLAAQLSVPSESSAEINRRSVSFRMTSDGGFRRFTTSVGDKY